jgi:alpha-tubulin suppressor-like RCC1 family protein
MGNGTVSSINTSPVSVIGGFTDWTQVSAGENHVAAIRANGTAWCWGSGTLGQLGQGTVASTRSSPVSVVGGFTDWVQIAAGSFVTRAIRANGTAWGWGVGRNTGSNTTTNRSSPVSVVGGFTDWVQISGRDFSAVAIRSQPKYKN